MNLSQICAKANLNHGDESFINALLKNLSCKMVWILRMNYEIELLV